MDFFFTKRELSWLDDLMPESKKKKLEDAEKEVGPGFRCGFFLFWDGGFIVWMVLLFAWFCCFLFGWLGFIFFFFGNMLPISPLDN